ncbi:NADP-dependent phosphogluconate dehydrogenase [Anaerorhabdus furcosa]|uniref:6-phosphogluconate dehydrogenase, decarboxylating n=1 Tax=Anaerorhabdus furcosa TaxID=118967 RepID=A0A1T4L9P3_9FIRM|nr:NADP-dependent phosphogluconate dehydrogenase [Anaerorhabdus furcosa]SJZ51227.1 6-phosphogluconate dehydrogenase [Anaerorhabdus furcosa]
MTKNQIGVLGLSTMGKNISINFMNRGFKVAGFNRTYHVTEEMMEEGYENFQGFENLNDFIDSLEKPRKVLLMIKAGEAIDETCVQLMGMLEEGDIVMDGGNSYFKDTIRRHGYMKDKKINYLGIGISGGEKGARNGPSIMPGGNREVVEEVLPFLNAIAAKKDGEPCCTYIGPNGAGHYVKMVHNGIEYADMQLLAESYLLLKKVGHFTNSEMALVFESWNQTALKSYLVEITAKILREKDEITGLELLDFIVDRASQKGTGKWTSMETLEQDQNTSLIGAAVLARVTSNFTELKEAYGSLFDEPMTKEVNPYVFQEEVRKAYYLGKIVAYAQGFALMKDASKRYDWNLDLGKIASIFRAGCIIQADLLQVIMKSYEDNQDLENLLLDEEIIKIVRRNIQSLRVVSSLAIRGGVPSPVLTSAMTYLDQLRSRSVGANLIQAQRDFFGAHTFERIDQEGINHHEWEK